MRKIRRRRTGEPAQPTPAPAPAPPPPPPPRTAEELVGGRSGIGAAMWALTRRKLRELEGTKWVANEARRQLRELKGRRWEKATEKTRVKEAERRARKEMAREAEERARKSLADRIEKETGKRYAESTLRKHAAAGTTPGTADGDKMVRQAAIDNAGSIDKFARSRGMTHSAVVRWRDHGGDLPEQYPDSLLLLVDFIATLLSKGARYKEDQLWSVEIVVTGDDVALVLEAERTGDYSQVIPLIADLAAEQFPWTGVADREFLVTEIVAITILR